MLVFIETAIFLFQILLPLINIVSRKLPSIEESFLSKVVTALLANNLSQLFLFSVSVFFSFFIFITLIFISCKVHARF